MSEAIGPTIHPTAVIAPGAVLIGQVTIEENCFIAPNAVLRGDIESITIKAGANVQDCCVLHTNAGFPTVVEEGATLGHGAMVHGATIGQGAVVGINATVLDGAHLGEASIVGAGAVVNAGQKVPPRSLAVGVPAKVIKEDDERVADIAVIHGIRYQEHREEHLAGRWGTVVGPHNDNGTFSR